MFRWFCNALMSNTTIYMLIVLTFCLILAILSVSFGLSYILWDVVYTIVAGVWFLWFGSTVVLLFAPYSITRKVFFR